MGADAILLRVDGTTDRTGCERIALGLDLPALDAAADWLIGRFGCDLGEVRIVTPGARSQRLLLGELVDRAAALGSPLIPPTLTTPRAVVHDLACHAAGEADLAGPLVVQRAWRLAVAALPESLREALSRAPRSSDAALADAVAASADSLAHNLIDIRRLDERTPDASQRDAAIAWVARDAIERLAMRRTSDATMLALEALSSGEHAGGAGPTVLLGVVELTPLERAAICASSAPLVSLILSEDLQGFDDLGVPTLEAWQHAAPLDLDLPVTFAGSPREQAEAAWSTLARLAEGRSADEVVMVAADPSLEPEIARAARDHDQLVHRSSGLPGTSSHAASFVHAVRDFLATRSGFAFATMLRHPWVDAWLCRREGIACERWLPEIDGAFATRAVLHLDDLLASAKGDDLELVEHLRTAIAEMLGALDPRAGARLAGLSATAAALADAIACVLDGSPLDPREPRDAASIAALQGFADARADAERVDAMGPLKTDEAIDLLLSCFSGVARADAAGAGAVEIIGWLEALLDPASAAVVLGLNEGVVPSTPGVDAFIPAALSQTLEPTRERRLARDAYILHALAASRKLGVVCGRVDAQGEPLRPSRLLLRGSKLLERTLAATGDLPAAGPVSGTGESGFGRWIVTPRPITSMRVTAFKEYINSPRLFYLRTVCRLSEQDGGDTMELEASGFGSLVHDVLKLFGRSDAKDLREGHGLSDCFSDLLSAFAHDLFGSRPRVAVRVQIEIARRRLGWLAWRQAEWRAQGWSIDKAEYDVRSGALDVDGVPMGLTGRVDRIDRNEDGRVAVLDYKTSAEATTPDAAHRTKRDRRWIDLQLPLYRHLLGLADSRVTLGYINIGRDMGSTQFEIAEWTDADLDEADEAAREVVRAIRLGKFDDIGNGAYDDDSVAAWAIGTGSAEIEDDQP